MELLNAPAHDSDTDMIMEAKTLLNVFRSSLWMGSSGFSFSCWEFFMLCLEFFHTKGYIFSHLHTYTLNYYHAHLHNILHHHRYVVVITHHNC